MRTHRTLTSSLSVQVVQYLLDKDFSQAEVARLLRVSDSFISLVKSRERGLTIDHLEALATALNVPLGALLIAVTRPASGGGELIRITDRLMGKIDELVAGIKEEQGREGTQPPSDAHQSTRTSASGSVR